MTIRRLAKQSREDKYASRRDYQTLITERALSVLPVKRDHHIELIATLKRGANTPYVAFAAFVQPTEECSLTVQLTAGGQTTQLTSGLGEYWNRIASLVEAPKSRKVRVVLEWPGHIEMHLWGATTGRVNLPDAAFRARPGVKELCQKHVAPETFYLVHEQTIGLEFDEGRSTRLRLKPGKPLTVKKCSYCGRLLPVDMKRLGSLSFHRHLAKRTLHQNECRACKKWRINDDFNPLRTTDQLHESSVITRERRLFLREPEILQEIKDRTGAGLKSQVWERFERKCFNCERSVALEEFQLDHTRPLAYLWPIDEHATPLCPECNNLKKEKFPIDFYNEAQLRDLAEVSGLPLAELRTKRVNPVELNRLIEEIDRFAQEWEPRTFGSTARRIAELEPDVDLFAILKKKNSKAHRDLMRRLRERPPLPSDLSGSQE